MIAGYPPNPCGKSHTQTIFYEGPNWHPLVVSARYLQAVPVRTGMCNKKLEIK
jgi:hypothetical protein